MISKFKKIDKQKYEDVIHIAFAVSHRLPIVCSEKKEKFLAWKESYPLVISTPKFWKFIADLELSPNFNILSQSEIRNKLLKFI